MGYTTEFSGHVAIQPEMSAALAAEIREFADMDSGHRPGHPRVGGMPDGYCQWTVPDGKSVLKWDGNEKFYDSVEWMRYLIEAFIKPAGLVANGEIDASGEDSGDVWKLVVVDNVVTKRHGRVVFD